MYERFSDDSKKVMQLANQEAIRANCEFIGVEHIITAVFLVSSGLGATALRNLGVNLSSLRAAIVKAGMEGPSMRMPMNPYAKSAIEAAIVAAREDQSQSIETEHMLLRLFADLESPALRTLAELGIQPDVVRAEIDRLRKNKQ